MQTMKSIDFFTVSIWLANIDRMVLLSLHSQHIVVNASHAKKSTDLQLIVTNKQLN